MAYQKVLKGDDPALTSLYSFRTAKDYAAYLLPHLKPNFNILDVGCGPGGITRDFAKLVPDGTVIGIDLSPGIVSQARESFQEPNLSFQVGDATNLAQFDDNTFDVVHAHCVVMHVPDPVKALKEMKRVVKPGGIVATRDPGVGMMSIKPDREPFTRLLTEYEPAHLKFLDAAGSCARAGFHKKEWALEAGFVEENGGRIWEQKSIEAIPLESVNLFASTSRDKAIELGIATAEQIDEWTSIWKEWAKLDEREALREFVDTLCFKPDDSSEKKNGT